jgi:hypothetical protein
MNSDLSFLLPAYDMTKSSKDAGSYSRCTVFFLNFFLNPKYTLLGRSPMIELYMCDHTNCLAQLSVIFPSYHSLWCAEHGRHGGFRVIEAYSSIVVHESLGVWSGWLVGVV